MHEDAQNARCDWAVTECDPRFVRYLQRVRVNASSELDRGRARPSGGGGPGRGAPQPPDTRLKPGKPAKDARKQPEGPPNQDVKDAYAKFVSKGWDKLTDSDGLHYCMRHPAGKCTSTIDKSALFCVSLAGAKRSHRCCQCGKFHLFEGIYSCFPH